MTTVSNVYSHLFNVYSHFTFSVILQGNFQSSLFGQVEVPQIMRVREQQERRESLRARARLTVHTLTDGTDGGFANRRSRRKK